MIAIDDDRMEKYEDMLADRLMGEQFDDEFLKFERVRRPFSQRPDMHAFILLDRLMPSPCGLVRDASKDCIYLNVDVVELLAVATKRQLADLARCGVLYHSPMSLLMFTGPTLRRMLQHVRKQTQSVDREVPQRA